MAMAPSLRLPQSSASRVPEKDWAWRLPITIATATSIPSLPTTRWSNLLYHNKGNGTFEEVGLLSEVAVDIDGRTYAGMGVDFADYNNDGWLDIVVTNLAKQRYALYQNIGDGSFTYTSTSSGISRMSLAHSGWGVRFLDYDNDGAIRALRDANLRVPEDVSVIGFDDIQVAAYHNPRLTTIRQPLHDMGETAARILLQRIQGFKDYPEEFAVAPELITRETTAPVNARSWKR